MIERIRALSPALLSIAVMAAACSTPSNRPVTDGARPLPPTPEVVTPPPDSAGPVSADDGSAVAAATEPESASEAAGTAADPTTGAPAGPVGSEVDDVSVAWPRSIDGSSDYTVASVAGRDISMTELVSKWVLRDPDGVRALLDDLVLSRIVVLESASLGLSPPQAEVDQTVKQRLELLERQARAAGAPDLETFVRVRLGFEPEDFLRNLKEESSIDRLAPRCVRSWLLSSDRREVRAITVADQAGVDQVQARLAKGDAFAEIAAELSTDASKEDGGRVPPLVRGESTLSRTAFTTDVGQVGGPVREGEAYLFVLVEAAPAAVEGTWAQIGEQVEASLAARDVEDPEFWQWKEAMSRRYDVDISPFLELVR